MQDHVDITGDMKVVRDVCLDQPEMVLRLEVSDILRGSGQEVVQTTNSSSIGDETVAQMRTQKAGASSDNGVAKVTHA